MVSDWEVLCDAIVTELTTTVPAISGANVPIIHKYTAQDPEELQADPEERHLAVWPLTDEAEVPVPVVTAPGGDILVQRYAVLYWEHVEAEAADGIVDQAATKTLLQLHNDIRARFYVEANMQLGSPAVPVYETRYTGSRLPERPGMVRWFALVVRISRTILVT